MQITLRGPVKIKPGDRVQIIAGNGHWLGRIGTVLPEQTPLPLEQVLVRMDPCGLDLLTQKIEADMFNLTNHMIFGPSSFVMVHHLRKIGYEVR